MQKFSRIAPIIVLLVVLIVFAFTQWLPLLLLLPAGAVAMLAGPSGYTSNLYKKPRQDQPPYE